jgi:protein-disulfide isomerase
MQDPPFDLAPATMEDETAAAPPPEVEQADLRPPQVETTASRLNYTIGLLLALTFMVGLVVGFLGRPLAVGQPEITVVVTVVPDSAPQSAAPADTQSSQAVSEAQPEPNAGGQTELSSAPAEVRPTPSVMDFLLSDARHVQGAADAPIAIIEFSDFK